MSTLSVVVKHKFGDFLDDELDELVYPEGAYGLSLITLSPFYRNISLDTLLMFIVTREVQVNGGRHLYVINPLADVLGFYIRLGFHPDPGGATIRCQKLDDATNFAFVNANFTFTTKLQIGRSYPLWRGQVDIVQTILSNKIPPLFQLHQPL